MRIISSFGAILLALGASAGLGFAQEGAAASSTNQPAFRLRGFQETLAPHWQLQHQLLVYSNTQISFTVPSEYRVQADPVSKSVVLDYQGDLIRNGSCRITLRLLPVPATTNALDGPWLRKQIIAAHPDARVTDDFPAALASNYGAGLELQTSRAGVATTWRMALIPLPETLVEITEVSGDVFMSRHRATLGQLMLSMRYSPLGTRVEYQTIRLE